MPNYTFKCNKCENKFNENLSIKEMEEGVKKISCPKCKSTDVKRIFSLLSFFSKDDHHKGGGCCGSGGCCS